VVELPFAADCCPCVEKLQTVLPLTVGIRDGVVQLVSTLSSAFTSARVCRGGKVGALRVEHREANSPHTSHGKAAHHASPTAAP
jgi:hypothetical protein